MRTLVYALCFAPTLAMAAGPSSFGVVGGAPEVIGLYGSTYVAPNLTIDAEVTVALVDAGVTLHVPMNYDLSILASAYGGYIHNLVEGKWYNYTGPNVGIKAGIGYERGIDVRLEGGISAQKGNADGGWGVQPAFHIMVGGLF